MSIELFINIVVICLLVPTIVFAIILNKRLEILRNSRTDLGRSIEAFNDATIRAETGIPKLKQAADEVGSALREEMQKAQTLHDDLAFMIERADKIAQQLENSTPRVPPYSQTISEKSINDSPVGIQDMKKNKQDGTTKTKKRRVLVEDPQDLISSAVSAAQEILRDTENRKNNQSSESFYQIAESEDIGADRSQTERELLKALQSMR